MTTTVKFTKPGAHILSGPANSGKSYLCRMIKWAISADPSAKIEQPVRVTIGSQSFVRQPDGSGSEVDSRLRIIYRYGVSGLRWIRPVQAVDRHGKVIDVSRCNLDKCRQQLSALQKEEAELRVLRNAIPSIKAELVNKISQLEASLRNTICEADAHLAACMGYIAQSGECPLFPVSCQAVSAATKVNKTDANILQDVQKKQLELEEARMRLEVINTFSSEQQIDARLAQLKARIETGQMVINSIIAHQTKAVYDSLKGKILRIGAELGINIAYTEDGYIVDGISSDKIGSTTANLLDYCIQAAADAPVAVIDGNIGKDGLQVAIQHANRTNRTAVFTVLSNTPIIMPGAVAWHLKNRKEYCYDTTTTSCSDSKCQTSIGEAVPKAATAGRY